MTMSDFASVWDSAGDDAESERNLRALTSARMRVAPVWGFLAASQSRQEFAHRLALQEDRVREAAEANGVGFDVLAKSLADDFHQVEASRPAPTKPTGVRRLAIYRVTAGDDSSAYYVVDEDTDKKVGGPYDDESGARAAISGGDVEGDDLGVEKGGGGDSDGDDDGDKDSDDDKGSDDSDDSEEKDDDESDDKKDEDDKGDNPFAKKESAKVANQYIKQEGDSWVITQKGTGKVLSHHDSKEKAEASFAAMMQSKHGSLQSVAHSDDHYTRNYQPGVGSYNSHEDYFKGDKPHGIYDSLGSAEKHLSRGGLNGWDDISGFNHCPSCDHVYAQDHPAAKTQTNNDHCPNCGDVGYHDSASDTMNDSGHDDQDPHYGDDYGHSEDNHGDPYGKFDEGGAWDQHRHGSTTAAMHPDYKGGNYNGSKYQVDGSTEHYDRGYKHGVSGNDYEKQGMGDGMVEYGQGFVHGRTDSMGPERAGAEMHGRTATQKIALEDGQDPLQWVIQSVPSGEGQPEKPDEHNETLALTSAIVERFRPVYADFAGE